MSADARLLYAGCFTPDGGGEGEGVTAVRRDPDTGDLTDLGLVARAPSPSFLAHHPHRPVLYAACRQEPEGFLAAWTTTEDGGLRPLGRAGTGGTGPCHLAVHPSGRFGLTAHYGSGSVAAHRLDPTGAPGARTALVVHPPGSHAHLVVPDPDGKRVDVVDLGADAVFHYRLDPGTGRLHRTGVTRTRPGTGPRHVASYGEWCYLVGELDGTLTCYRRGGAGGGWRAVDRVPLCADGAAGAASGVVVSRDGRYVYAAVRGPDRIATFATAPDDSGRLRPVGEVACGGHWPRHLTLVGDHLYAANERSHSIVTFRVDPDTGVPAPTGNRVETPSPSCIVVPANQRRESP